MVYQFIQIHHFDTDDWVTGSEWPVKYLTLAVCQRSLEDLLVTWPNLEEDSWKSRLDK